MLGGPCPVSCSPWTSRCGRARGRPGHPACWFLSLASLPDRMEDRAPGLPTALPSLPWTSWCSGRSTQPPLPFPGEGGGSTLHHGLMTPSLLDSLPSFSMGVFPNKILTVLASTSQRVQRKSYLLLRGPVGMKSQWSLSWGVETGDRGPWLEPHESGNMLVTRPPGLGVLRREKLAELGHFHLQLPASQLKPAKVKMERLVRSSKSPGRPHSQPW